MNQQGNKMWKALAFTMLASSVVVFAIGYAGLATHYFNTRPHNPDPSTGRIYGYNYHGIVVYLTDTEQHRLDLFTYLPIFLFGGGTLIAVGKLKMKIGLQPRK
jgi:hypothetical protein